MNGTSVSLSTVLRRMAGFFVVLMALATMASATSPDIVISQVYGGGGNSGATYKNDFIELYNRGSAAVNVSTWSVQYSSAAGTTWQKTNLSGTIQPGHYYLIQEAAGAGGSVNLPAPDATGGIAMSATSGKIALANHQVTLSGASPSGLIDLVGYGSTANFFEGTGPTATLTNTTAALRAGNGAVDTDNNSSDFSTGAPNPRNSNPGTGPTGVGAASPNPVVVGNSVLLTVTATPGSSPASVSMTVSINLSSIGDGASQAMFDDGTHGDVTAGDNIFSYQYTVPVATTPGAKALGFTVTDDQARFSNSTLSLTVNPVPPAEVAIHDIQGSGTTSPMTGVLVSTSGIVTARKSNGFFLQTPDASADADPNTSEGVFVFTSSAPPAAAAVGNAVQVVGRVQEFVPSADTNSPPVTEIGSAPTVTLISTGNPLPAPVPITIADTDPTGSIHQLEKYEGMRVHVDTLNVVGSTGGSVDENDAVSNTSGVFYGVLPGIARPFREPGIETPDPFPAGSPANIPVFDANPERIRVDTKGQTGSTPMEVTAGVVVSNLTGPLDYSFRAYTILQDPSPAPTATPNASATPAPTPLADELTVATFNLERFFDTTDDPGVSDVALTPTAFANRLNKASLAIRTVMNTPDIVGVEEMENLATLQAVADKVNADAVGAGDPDPAYVPYLVEGNDIGGIDVGFLVKSNKVTVNGVTQVGKGATYIDPNNGQPALLNDRPTLVLDATVSRSHADDLNITVLVNHLRSLSGVDDPADGARVRAKRRAQAEFLADYIQSLQSGNPALNLISVGDYNAFGFNDGYVDSMGTIRGMPTPFDQVVLASDDLVDPDLSDLADLLPPDQRYTYNFDGNAQELDHVLVNGHLLTQVSRFAIARVDSDFPETFRNDPNRPERISDHDPAVAYIQLPAQDFDPPVLHLPADIVAEATSPAGADVSYTATARDAVEGDVAIACTPVSGSTFAITSTTVDCSASDSRGNTATGSFTVTVQDSIAPQISILMPTSATYTIHQTVNADYSCSDGGSGLATCVGTVADGAAVDTNSVGSKSFTVNATDNVGNASTQTVGYNVGYNVCVMYDTSKAAKAGSTLPVKLELCDGSGNNLSSAGTVVHAINLVMVSASSSFLVQDSGNANPDNDFRYDSGMYIFNLSTKGLNSGSYLLMFSVSGDPTPHSTLVQIK